MRDKLNIIPVAFALLLHALLAAALLFGVSFSKSPPPTPLAITGKLVTEADLQRAPAQKPPPEPVREPEPQPVPPEPEPEPEDNTAAELEAERIRAAEEAKRQADLKAEQERVRQQQQAEQERIRKEQQAEQQRQQKAAEERKQREEAEKERQRLEAEKKRLADIERQRKENEQRKREAAEAERQRLMDAEMAEEAARLDAMNSGALARYIFAIQQQIQRNWIQPASISPGIECVVLVRQLPGGQVTSVRIERCNGDAAVQRSIEAAVYKASPLPEPEDPSVFDRNLRIIVKPEQ